MKLQDLRFRCPPKLIPLFTSKKRFNCAYGGRGSGKTIAMGAVSLKASFEGEGHLIICRFTGKSIDSASKATIERAIRDQNMQEHFKIANTYIQNKITGSEMVFSGLSKRTMDNIASIDNCYFAWIDEGHTIPPEAWARFYPSIRGHFNDGRSAQIFVTFNPHKEEDTFWKEFVLNPQRQDLLLIKINHEDNPWFKFSSLASDLESDKLYKNNAYVRHIWGGELQQYNDAPVIDASKFGRFDDGENWEYSDLIISADTAYSVKESADYSVLMLMGLKQRYINEPRDAKQIHILRVMRGRWEFGDLRKNLEHLYFWAQDKVRAPDLCLIEDKASGKSLIQALKQDTTLPIKAYTPTKDKFARVMDVLEIIHRGEVMLPLSGDALNVWIKDFLLECTMFKGDISHDHDDQVDALSQGLALLAKNANYSKIWSSYATTLSEHPKDKKEWWE